MTAVTFGLPYPAEQAYEALSLHAGGALGRERGDCPCAVCGEIVADICRVLGIDPATPEAMRAGAQDRGWGPRR